MKDTSKNRANNFWKNRYNEVVESAKIPENVNTVIVHFKSDNLLIGKGGILLNDRLEDTEFETPVAIVTK